MNNNLPVVPNEIADSLINHSGVITQKIILIEECSELQKELCKNIRNIYTHNDDSKNRKLTVTEEMAHVLFSMQVVMKTFGITPEDLEREFQKKISAM